MFQKNFEFSATKAILPVAMLCVLSLSLQAVAQEYDWISQQPAMTYTSSVESYAPVETAPVTFPSPNEIGAQPIHELAPTYSAPLVSISPAPTYSAPVYASPSTPQLNSTSNVQPGLAQSKAVQAAQMGLRGHLGGGLGGARYEGVGWSTQSPRDAIEHCCYWGTRPTAQIGVSKGRDGFWYACVLYY